MKIYRVGGSVRDELLGLPVADRDYVVVGATPEALVDKGFKPVGRDFPVFLHPVTHEEYALARTERKTGPGYRGFAFYAAPDVTLEQDLARRDFTINAMAIDDAGQLIDPYRGADDLKAGVLRHVGEAFVEDPVRILRAARFVARFAFRIAPETLQLMRQMAHHGEVDHLVPERVWQELARGLAERHPVRMFVALDSCDALARILPELAPFAPDAPHMVALEQAGGLDLSLAARFAVMMGTSDEARITSLCQRIRVPNDARDLALLYSRCRAELARGTGLDAAATTDLLYHADAWRQSARFLSLIAVAHLYAPAVTEPAARSLLARRLNAALQAGLAVDAGAVARQHTNPAQIQAAVKAARVTAIHAALERVGTAPA